MADGRLERFLNRFGDVRGGEARAALALSGYFFLITFTFYILKPVKESFLISFARPGWWPYAELATALLIGFVVAFNARLLDRMPRRTFLTASLLFFIASLFAFWFIFNVYQSQQFHSPMIDPSGMAFTLWLQIHIIQTWPFAVFVIAFCFWTDVFIAMTVTQFWIAVNDVFKAHQAKRLVGLFVTGGLFGGIAGSAVAALATFARAVRPGNLLLVAPGLLVLAAVTVNAVYAERQKIDPAAGDGSVAPASRIGLLESFRAVRRSRYLLLLAAMLAAAMVSGALINYQFKTVVKIAIGNTEQRTSFIAVLFLGILAVSTVFHLVTTRRVLDSYGIRWALVVAPAVLVAVSLSVFLIPAGLLLWWACAARGTDKTFDNTLSQSVRELLYVPVPADIKYKGKIFIDMFVSKFATGLGAALFLAFYKIRQFEYRDAQTLHGALVAVREAGFLTLFFLVLWLVLTQLVYREYPAVLKKDIRRKWKLGSEAVAEHVDVELTHKIFDTIQSRERSTTLYYMNVFNLVSRGNLTPELKELLGIKRDELKARAMDALFDVGGGAFYPGLEEAIADEEFRNEIDLVFLLPVYQEVMGRRLGEIAGSASEVDRIEAATSISRMVPNEATLAALGRLLEDPSSEVVLYALESAAVHRRPEHVPLVLRHLANPMTCAAAQAALAAYGPGVEALVGPALRSDGVLPAVRRAIPDVMARVGTQRAADILLEELARRREDLEHPIVEALARIRAERPAVRFRGRAVRAELLHMVRKACETVLDPPGAAEEAAAVLAIRIRRVFDVMTLLYPREDVVNAYQNLLRGTARTIDSSIEHLDNFLDRELKGLVLPLIEDLPAEEKAQRLRKAMRLK